MRLSSIGNHFLLDKCKKQKRRGQAGLGVQVVQEAPAHPPVLGICVKSMITDVQNLAHHYVEHSMSGVILNVNS